MITFITDPYIIDPLGIAYLAAMLKEGGHEVKLVLTTELDKVKIDTPIVAYSTTTGKHQDYLKINRYIKEKHPGKTAIFGGPHCTFFPEFAKEKGVDFIFRGEGFQAIVDFCDNFIKSRALNTDRLYSTSNIAYFDGEKVVQNDLYPPMRMSELPFPDRVLIYQYTNNRIRNVMASFLCPMNCTYCFNHRFKKLGYNVRLRSVESVIEECAQLVHDYPTELIYFQDDIFPVYRQDWLQSFCREYKGRVKVPFHIQVRVEMLDKNNLRCLNSAGLHGVTFAIETADYAMRSGILKRHVANGQILDTAELLHKYDIRFRIENMLGLPDETLKSALATLDLNLQCRPTIGWASLYTPYPGTDLGDSCREEGLVDMQDFDGDFFTHATLKLKDKKRIERAQKLFSLVCMFPQLRPLLPLLTRLPFKYKGIYSKVKQYLYDNRLYKI